MIPLKTESRVTQALWVNTGGAPVPVAVDVSPLFIMGEVLLGVHVLSLLLQPQTSSFGLWAALAEQMGAKWLFLEAKTLLIPF